MDEESVPSIAVCGVGGAGCNTINRLIKMGLEEASLFAFNTDKKHLSLVGKKATHCLLGPSITKGLGAGGHPEIAERAALFSRKAIAAHLSGKDIVFIACGMGGGTGTGAAPVIAEIAKKKGALVVAFCTYPFAIEKGRQAKALHGIERMRQSADTVVLIDNNRLVDYAPNLPIEQSFMLLDEIVAKAIRGISKTILEPSLLNLDFMDLRAVMEEGGISLIAVGEASGYSKVEDAAEAILKNRLLDANIEGAKSALLHITGGEDLTLGEATRLGELLTQQVSPDANVIYGARTEPSYHKKIEAIAIFTGLSSSYTLKQRKI
ncbi:MAG: cell division protein FtsZ [Candidatus Micrarchaeota archaeon]|nr:cell division protein FtsZ [Candidatus Micrarchaeota archaeon]